MKTLNLCVISHVASGGITPFFSASIYHAHKAWRPEGTNNSFRIMVLTLIVLDGMDLI